MANFDPQVQPTQPGNYIFWSRPIQQPRPDEAGETLGRAVGSSLSQTGRLVAEGSNLANQVEQKGISEQLAQQYDPVRDTYIQRLSQIDDVMAGRKPEQSLAEPTQQTGQLSGLPSKIDDLIAIRDNGRVSPTYFNMMRDQVAKQLRAQYPHQRDYIDSEFSRITERDPANKVIQSLQQDINAYAQAAKQKQDKNEARIYNSGVPGLYEAVYVKHILPEDKAITIAAQRQAQKAGLEMQDLKLRNAAAKLALGKALREDTENNAAQDATDSVYKDVALDMNEWTVKTPQLSDENIGTFLNEWQSGKHQVSDEEAIQLRQSVDRRKAAEAMKLRQMFFKVNDTGRSMADYVGGPDKAEKIIQDALKQYDTIGQLFAQNAIPQAIAHKSMLEGAASDAGYNLYKDVPWAAQTHAVNTLFGGQSSAAAAWVQSSFNNPDVNKDLKNWAHSVNMGLITQSKGYSLQGGIFSLGEALSNGAAKGIKGPDGAKANQHVINTMGSTIANQENPPQVITNAATATFGPEDSDLMNKFKSSEIDKYGRILPGKSTVFSSLVNDKVSKSIRRLGNPEITKNYVDSANSWFGNLFHTEIASLNENTPVESNDTTIEGAVARSEPKSKYHVVYDARNLSFHVQTDKEEVKSVPGAFQPMYVRPTPSWEESSLRNAVTKLNAGIQSISSVYRTFAKKDDVNGLLLQLFIQSGLNPSRSLDTPAGQLFEAIKSSQTKQVGKLNDNRDE